MGREVTMALPNAKHFQPGKHIVGFSNGLYDSDGDKYDDSILIHVNDTTIIKFESFDQLQSFYAHLGVAINELGITYRLGEVESITESIE